MKNPENWLARYCEVRGFRRELFFRWKDKERLWIDVLHPRQPKLFEIGDRYVVERFYLGKLLMNVMIMDCFDKPDSLPPHVHNMLRSLDAVLLARRPVSRFTMEKLKGQLNPVGYDVRTKT